ncbi:MAG: sulfite exporter TauE/SafE family protein [Proteobacteria bacterium]|nr:sulfite exporter TauE/SafE family protein [Pseudomonadota bacterium]
MSGTVPEPLAALIAAKLAAALAIAALAGLIRGFTGFGAPLLMAPVLAYLYGPAAAVPAIVLMELPTSVQLVPAAWRRADWPLVAAISGGAAVLTPFGAFLLVALDPALTRRLIGAVLVGFVAVLLAGWRYRGPRPLWASALVGAMSGLMKGATSFGGPPVLLYLLSGPEAAIRHRANLIMMIAVMNVFAIAAMALNGLVTVRVLALALVLLPALMGGVGVGARLFARAGEALFRRVALGLLLAVGILSLIA